MSSNTEQVKIAPIAFKTWLWQWLREDVRKLIFRRDEFDL
jgi:hypothetical protein